MIFPLELLQVYCGDKGRQVTHSGKNNMNFLNSLSNYGRGRDVSGPEVTPWFHVGIQQLFRGGVSKNVSAFTRSCSRV